MTLDLKSGSKVNIGTYAITLDKFFEGNLKATKVFDIGNGKGVCVMWEWLRDVYVCRCKVTCEDQSTVALSEAITASLQDIVIVSVNYY